MDLKEKSPRTRSVVLGVWSVGLGALYFVVLPIGLRLLTETLGWPRWHLPGGSLIGPASIAAGAALVFYCNRLFSRIGEGSIVPIDPTKKLVIVGPYRYSRNPVYVGYLTVLLGVFLAAGDLLLLLYTGAFFFYLEFFIRREEPDLLDRFGSEYSDYLQTVPRWLGRVRRAAQQGAAADRLRRAPFVVW